MRLPHFYWMISYRMKRHEMYSQWDDLYKPQGELISSIIAPDHFSEYMKVKSQKHNLQLL